MRCVRNRVACADGLQRTYWSCIGRLIAAALFLIHLIPFVTVGSRLVESPSLKLVVSFLAIVGIMAFALLKAMDVKALRLRLNGRKWCTLIVLGLFFHGDVVAKQLPEIIVAESAMVLLVGIACVSRRLQQRVIKLIASLRLQMHEYLYACLEEVPPAPLVPVYALLGSPRPPPLR